ncbi:MAG: hypothetical protein KGD63_00200 [Candidatus Lokiarchaeota archaeon]|nr:hypothetical protein [Candidatus Lokiarchaeota archaeon]
MSDIQSQLKEHLTNAKDWEKMETPIPGVFVVKVPASKTKPALLFLEINPLKSDGNPMKRKGLFIKDYEMLIRFSEALTDDKVVQVIKELEDINPEIGTSKTKKLKM